VKQPDPHIGDQIAHTGSSPLILHGAHDTTGLIEGVDDSFGLGNDQNAVHADFVVPGGPGTKLSNDLTVDLDPPPFDQDLAIATGSYACLGQQLLQPDGLGQGGYRLS